MVTVTPQCLVTVASLAVTGWAGSLGQDSCACGVAGHCQGGPGFKCNCDLEDGEIRSDGAVIIRHDRLPVCQVSWCHQA